MTKGTGKIIQIVGVVVDVEFKDSDTKLPAIYDALHVKHDGRTLTLEVAQHLDEHTVRAIALQNVDGLKRGSQVVATGAPISVRGAADSVGEPAANQSLSEQRAAAVAAQLVALGLPAAGISSLGLGETTPVASETNADGSESEIGRQVNRRVEIVVG